MNAKFKVFVCVMYLTGIVMIWKEWGPAVFFVPQDTRSCDCDTCLTEHDPWFTRRFNRSVKPFLTENRNLSEGAFKWWKNLQKETRSFTVFRATVAKLFQTFPSTPNEPRSDGCMSCAVVGNSGNLKGSHYGRLIDLHHVIIRMNAGKTKGYEADVGTRTTHRVMYPESAVDLDNSTHLVLFPFKILDLQWLIGATTTGFSGHSYAPLKSKIKANKDLVMVVSPEFMRYVHEMWLDKKGGYPSTGFMTLILAMHVCDKVHVFGFGADSDGNWSHYWEKLRQKNLKTGLHPGSYEYRIILELAEKQKLTFFKG